MSYVSKLLFQTGEVGFKRKITITCEFRVTEQVSTTSESTYHACLKPYLEENIVDKKHHSASLCS